MLLRILIGNHIHRHISAKVFRVTTKFFSTSQELVVDASRQNGVVVLGMNRPAAKNAISRNLLSAFEEALLALRNSLQARCVILRSLVPGVFCAGADLKERATMRPEEVGPFVARARKLMNDLYNLPLPTIAAIDGVALGGGLELSLACDLRTAAQSAKLGLTETHLAIIPGAGGTQRLPRLISVAKAKELIFCAEAIDGLHAEQIGLVNASVSQNAENNAAFLLALAFADKIAENGPIGVRMAKKAINEGMQTDIQSGLAIEETCYAQVIPTRDRIEGLTAFKEKRRPCYKGE